jgi:aldehyde dehydrogenase (NAD+)
MGQMFLNKSPMKDPKQIIQSQKRFFESGKTRDISFIKIKLKLLKESIISNEDVIHQALYKDLKKPKFEAYISEFAILISEIDILLNNLSKWSKPKKVRASKLNFPSKDYIYSEPYGTVLVISPWNYPFQLAISPVISAIASGNTVVLKPSEVSSHTGLIIKTILSEIFNDAHLYVELGGVSETTKLLKERWDYIFFTGSVAVGKIIAKAAAVHLTPVTLELGGKNPCIVDESADLKLTAKRLVWGKFLNAGQTCIAPDYVLVNNQIKADLVKLIKTEIFKAYGEDPEISPNYPRIVNANNLQRLISMLEDAEILLGGNSNISDNYLSPTLVNNPKLDSKLMEEEIFGPILPILDYKTEKDIEYILKSYEKPLGFYVFSKNKAFYNSLIKKYSFGGGAVNDTMIHFGNPRLPFGGVGESGIGAYRGHFGYETFTHKKGITFKANWLDIPLRYAPYKNKLKLLKKAFKWLG